MTIHQRVHLTHRRSSSRLWNGKLLSVPLVAAALCVLSSPARALEVRDDDDHFLKLKGYLQPQYNLTILNGKNNASVGVHDDKTGVQQNFSIRRARLLFLGKVHKNVGFFVGTLTANIGHAPKYDQKPATVIADAWLQGDFGKQLRINFGLLKMPFSRHCIQGGGGLHGLDYHGFFLNRNTAVGPNAAGKTVFSVGGVPTRDTGVMLRGILAGNMFEYRMAVTDGIQPNGRNHAGRFTGRLAFNAFDADPAFFYKGIYFNKKKMLQVGFSFDMEPGVGGEKHDALYAAFAGDVFADLPIGKNELVSNVSFYHYGKGTSRPEGNGMWGDLGVRFGKIEPLVAMEWYKPSKGDNGKRTVVQAGLNWWIKGHTANLKGQFGMLKANGGTKWGNTVTVQGQFMF